mgnify:CR=1 FL=1
MSDNLKKDFLNLEQTHKVKKDEENSVKLKQPQHIRYSRACRTPNMRGKKKPSKKK